MQVYSSTRFMNEQSLRRDHPLIFMNSDHVIKFHYSVHWLVTEKFKLTTRPFDFRHQYSWKLRRITRRYVYVIFLYTFFFHQVFSLWKTAINTLSYMTHHTNATSHESCRSIDTNLSTLRPNLRNVIIIQVFHFASSSPSLIQQTIVDNRVTVCWYWRAFNFLYFLHNLIDFYNLKISLNTTV